MSLLRGLKRALERPAADRAVVVISLALLAFSLDTGLSADDYVHKLIAQGARTLPGFIRAPLDMFRFTGGGRGTAELVRQGVLSWWEDPEAKMAFFRPLAALTHYADYTLWPDHPWAMHLHSMLWAALLLWGVLALYRVLISPSWVCALAMFLYALDDARGWLVSWIAARNAVIATGLSVWALYFHIRARSNPSRTHAFVAPLLFGLALLAGEGALSICAYLLGYALWLDRAPVRERVRSLLPYGVVAALWLITYRALDYGVSHSGLYFDPLREPAAFIGALLERGPILMFAQLGGAWSDAYSVMFTFPVVQRVVLMIAVLFVIAFAYVVWPLVRRDPTARFAAFGALLSVLPAAATFMADRMLTWVAIGACLLVARLIDTYLEDQDFLTSTALRALLVPPLMLWFAVTKIVIEPMCLPSRARGNMVVRDSLDRAEASVPSDASIEQKHVIYVNPAGMPLAGYVLIERAGTGVPQPRSQLWLATGETEVRVGRVDARTLRVRQRGGFLLNPSSRLLRSAARPFTRGMSSELDGARIEVSDLTADGRPAEILAHFDVVLEDPSLLWLQWGTTGYLPFKPPPIGQTVTLPAADFVRVVLGDDLRFPIDGRMPAPIDGQWVASP
jgi:hypothetical protein